MRLHDQGASIYINVRKMGVYSIFFFMKNEFPLGVIREQGECPWRKGAKTKWSRETGPPPNRASKMGSILYFFRTKKFVKIWVKIGIFGQNQWVIIEFLEILGVYYIWWLTHGVYPILMSPFIWECPPPGMDGGDQTQVVTGGWCIDLWGLWQSTGGNDGWHTQLQC